MVFSYLILREAWREDELRNGETSTPMQLLTSSAQPQLVSRADSTVPPGSFRAATVLGSFFPGLWNNCLFIKCCDTLRPGISRPQYPLEECSYGGTVSTTKAVQEMPRECPAELLEVEEGTHGLFPEAMSRDTRQIRKETKLIKVR